MSPNWFLGFPVNPKFWYDKVITKAPAGIKCFAPADLHITFAFLGAVGEEAALRVWEIARKLTLDAVSCSLGPMAPFGNPEKPSAYAFTLDKGGKQIAQYMRDHQREIFAAVGKKGDKYAPRPHLTVARPPRNASVALRAEGLAWLEQVVPPKEELLIDTLALYTWSDDRKRRQFKIVESRTLGNR